MTSTMLPLCLNTYVNKTKILLIYIYMFFFVFQVLVEYDDVEWHRREWISVYREGLFHLFMVEQGLHWAERTDPFCPSPLRSTVLWPALVSFRVERTAFFTCFSFFIQSHGGTYCSYLINFYSPFGSKINTCS